MPAGYDWPSLTARDGDALETHYRHVLETLAKKAGMLGIIFRKGQNKVQDLAQLRRLSADLIDRAPWTALDADVQGDAFEGLLEKNAQETRGGAGPSFTPRPLLRAVVEVVRLAPGETLCDPACGTGGFLRAAHDSIIRHHPKPGARWRGLSAEGRKCRGTAGAGGCRGQCDRSTLTILQPVQRCVGPGARHLLSGSLTRHSLA